MGNRTRRSDDIDPRTDNLCLAVSRRAMYGLDKLTADARQRLGPGVSKSFISSILFAALADSRLEIPEVIKNAKQLRIYLASKLGQQLRIPTGKMTLPIVKPDKHKIHRKSKPKRSK